jgi:hypothetical protein
MEDLEFHVESWENGRVRRILGVLCPNSLYNILNHSILVEPLKLHLGSSSFYGRLTC